MYLCHAKGEDDSIVNALSCQLNEYGITLHDFTSEITEKEQYHKKELINRLKGRVEAEKYVLIILSDQLCADITALYELHHIMPLFLNNKVKIFTLVLKNRCVGIPNRLEWLLHTDLYEMEEPIDLQNIILAVLESHLQEMQRNKEQHWEQNVLGQSLPYSDLFIIEMLRIYRTLSDQDIKARSTVIYAIYTYLEKIYHISFDHILYFRCIAYFNQYEEEIPFSARQISVMEKCLALAFLEAKSMLTAKSY